MQTIARSPRQSRQAAISLYTLLAAVVVLGVLTSVLVTSFTGMHSKGTAAWSLVKSVAQASERFHLDTSCWPTRIDALWDYNASSNNTCETTIPERMWHGPYLTRMQTNDSHRVLTPNFGPTATLRLDISPSGQLKVKTDGMTDEMINALITACHGGEYGEDDRCFVQKTNKNGISYIYDLL